MTKLIFFSLLLISVLTVKAQPLSLSLLYGSPSEPMEKWSTGNVFQVGNQIGDASIYALFGGNGTKSFQIVSPGESLTKSVTSNGYFNIRPTSSMVVDQSKILNFNGTISGSVNVIVRPLSIGTILRLTETVLPGATLPILFQVGIGTFPAGLGFAVQLVSTEGNFIQNLPSTPVYTEREPTTYSSGDIRSIPATLPGNLSPGIYRVRVVTTGLSTTVLGTNSAAITVQGSTSQIPINTVITNINPHTICAGNTGTVQLTWTATDDGQQSQRYVIGIYAPNASSTDVPIRTITGQGTYSQSSGALKTLTADVSGLNSLSVGSYKLAILHSTISSTLNFSNPFVVQDMSSVSISDGTAITNAGQAATVKLTFSGSGPWSFSYDDLKNGLQTVTNQSNNSVLIPIYPTSDYLFTTARLLTFSGACGSGTKSGSSQIRVSQLSLTLGAVSIANPCPGNTITASFTVSGNVPTGTRYSLQFSDANGSFANPREIASGTTSPLRGNTPVNDAPGVGYKVRIVSSFAALPASVEANVTLSRPELPGVTAYSFCLGTAPPSLTATGSNLQWYSNDDSGQALGQTAPIPPNDRSSSYRVTQSVDGCASSPALITITAKDKSRPPIVSSPVNACQNQPAVALTANGVNLLWFNANQQGLGSNGPIPTTGSTGNQTFYVSQNANGCRSDQATVTVSVAAQPAAPVIINPSPICQFAQATNVVLGNAVNGQNLQWYEAEKGGSANGQAPVPRTTIDGTERYYVSQTVNGCESSRARVEQIVVKAPEPPTVSISTVLLCLNSPPRSLTASGINLRWYEQPVGSSPLTNAPIPVTTRTGLTSYYVSQISGANNCESSRLQIDVSVLAQPVAPIVNSSQSVCQNANAVALQAPGTNLLWNGPGISGNSSSTPIPPTNAPATLTYQVSQQVGNCISPSSTIMFTIKPQPAAPIVASPLRLCQGAAARDLFASGENLQWFNTPDGIGNSRDRVSISPSTTGVFNYYVQQTVNGCTSSLNRLEVRVSQPARATLSGDSIVTLFDSTAIRIRFTGDSPYSLILWNGKSLVTSDNPLIVWEKPTVSNASYTLRSLSNECGSGDIGNTYRLSVRVPLAVEPFFPGQIIGLQSYPNPVNGPLTIIWQAPAHELAVLKLTALNGQTVWQEYVQGTGNAQTKILSTQDWAAGIYLFTLATESLGKLHKRLIIMP